MADGVPVTEPVGDALLLGVPVPVGEGSAPGLRVAEGDAVFDGLQAVPLMTTLSICVSPLMAE